MTRLHNAAIPHAIVNGAVHVLGMIATGAVLMTTVAAITPSLGEKCDAGNSAACRLLANRTDGQCASPRGLGGCAYDSLATY